VNAPREDMRRLLFVRAGELGLSRDERLELANYLLRPREDITTWAQLDAIQTSRMLDAFAGFELINQLLALRVRPDIPPPDPEQLSLLDPA
jgi:hypothetical protein